MTRFEQQAAFGALGVAPVVRVDSDEPHAGAVAAEAVRALGAGDAHCGVTVQHRSRVAQDPTQPNLRQVHLIHAELFDELAGAGFSVQPGDMGENITTRGIALLDLSTGALLQIGGVVRRAGVMAVFVSGGAVHPGDAVTAALPAGPHRRLERV